MRKRLLLIVLLIAAAMAYFLPPKAASSSQPIDVTVYTKGGERIYRLETATTPSEREIGLMNRDTLKPNDGMLFVFPSVGIYKFWMKNTRIPLDMVFIDEQFSVVGIEASATPQTLTHRGPDTPVIAVIELDGGRAAREGIALGDKVRYVLPQGMAVQ